MDSKLRNLIWSEFRQRRTQLIVLLLVAVGGAALCIGSAIMSQVPNFRTVRTVAALYVIFAPIFLAMRTSLGEVTDRSRSFSDGLPISARRRAWIRLAGGAATLIVPFLVAAMLLSQCLSVGWLETAVMAWSATCLYLLLALLGTTLRAEAQLGYCGAAIAYFWILSEGVRHHLLAEGCTTLAACVGALVPISIDVASEQSGRVGDLSIVEPVLGQLAANTVVQLILAVLFVRRYCRILTGSMAAPAVKTAWRVGWRPRLSTPDRALAWLAWRQSVPMCLPGLAIACVTAALNALDASYSHSPGQALQHWADELPRSMAAIGVLWAVVVGAGVFSSEIDWRIGEFWRTRPISAGRMFGIKFFAGLLAVLLVLDGSVSVATWWSPRWGQGNDSMNWRYIACMLPLHATMFTLSVAWTCLVRQAVLGGMAALATLIVTEVVLHFFPSTRTFTPLQAEFHFSAGKIEFTGGYLIVMAELVLAMLASFVVGWLTLRRYDPRRQTG